MASHIRLGMDLGELADEPEALYAHTDLAYLAAGVHAGDDHHTPRALARCLAHGVRVGVHPSFNDREGFGRRAMSPAMDELVACVREQILWLNEHAKRARAVLSCVKFHGALYGYVDAHLDVAHALLACARELLGPSVVCVGPAQGATRQAASALGLAYLREAFADRGVDAMGRLLPRGTPGSVLDDPALVRARVRSLLADGGCDVLCVHGDTAGAVSIAATVRAVLDAAKTPVSTRGLRVPLPAPLTRGEVSYLSANSLIKDFSFSDTELLLYGTQGALHDALHEALARARVQEDQEPSPPRTHTLSVHYDGEDLDAIAAHVGCSPSEVIAMHHGRTYSVQSLGFLPGFAYLGAVDPRLEVPRRASPRARVRAHSVAIADRYTAVYPFASPGGWNLLGHLAHDTLFDQLHGATLGLQDRVRFVPCLASDCARCNAIGESNNRRLQTPETPHGVRFERLEAPALVQDRGRQGWLWQGIARGGALWPAMSAHTLRSLDAPDDAAVIELYGAARIRAERAPLWVSVDGETHWISQGESLDIARSERARVRYLALGEGVDAPLCLGGRGQLLRAELGGLKGAMHRPLRRGDWVGCVQTQPAHADRTTLNLSHDQLPTLYTTVRVFAEESDGRFAPEALAVLFDHTWELDARSDRVAVRLIGPHIPRARDDRGASRPMEPGAIEVASDGVAMVLGPDQPTTGGYPVLAVVHPDDLASIFAARAMTRVQFVLIEP
ncbi:MAG: LamB/YcsF family protein [Deltaproteobacteria bacterium]|nr:LamB/YcsF family protein [Deltaproteobacteria bacterium]